VGGQIIPLISNRPVDLVGSWLLLAALAFWQFIPVYSSMVLPPAWVLEGASSGSQQAATGGAGWHAGLEALSPLLWLAPYTIYVIIIMAHWNLP
jgi:hypothetical protein